MKENENLRNKVLQYEIKFKVISDLESQINISSNDDIGTSLALYI